MTNIDNITLGLRICDRAENFGFISTKERLSCAMDLAIAMDVFNIDVQTMINASISEFAHDFYGIRNNITRNKGVDYKYTKNDFNGFEPKFILNKQNNQNIPTNKQTKSYSSATRDPIASNKQVVNDNPNNRSIDKQR